MEDPPAKQDTAENYQYVFLFVSFTIVYGIVVFPSNLDVCDWRFRKVCPQCNTVVHVKKSVCNCGHIFALHGVLLLGTMKRRKALLLVLSEEELLVRKERDKVCKASKRASETHEQTLHRQEQN